MAKHLVRVLLAAAAVAALLAFSGCLRFENSLDLNVPLTRADNGVNPITSPAEQNSTTAPNGDTVQQTPADPAQQTNTYTDPTAAPNGQPDNTAQQGQQPTAEQPTAQQQPTAGQPTAQQQPTAEQPTAQQPAAQPTESTTAAPDVNTVAGYVQSLGTTEYDILRTNNFTLEATFIDEGQSSPLSMSMGDGQLYFKSDMDGMELGMYIADKKTYIYLPGEKKYLKLNSALAKLLQMDPDEFSEMAAEMGFDKLPALSDAQSMADTTYDGVNCKVFTLISTDGSETMRVYMNGKKLVALEYLDSAGNVTSTMRVTSVTSGFPKMPPDGYTEMSYIEFAKTIMAGMDT